MVISQPPGNNPSYYYRASATLPHNCSECFQRHLIFLYMQLQHQGNSLEMVLLSIFFTRIRSTEGSSADCSLFILSLHALALHLHLAVKILLQIFLYEDLSTLALHTSVSCISLQNASRTALYLQQYCGKNHFLIFDKSSINTRGQFRLKRQKR